MIGIDSSAMSTIFARMFCDGTDEDRARRKCSAFIRSLFQAHARSVDPDASSHLRPSYSSCAVSTGVRTLIAYTYITPPFRPHNSPTAFSLHFLRPFCVFVGSEAASYRNKNFYGVNPILQDHEVDEKNRGLKKTSWANRSQVGVYVGFDLSSYYKGDPRLIKMKKKQNGWHGANDDLKGAGGNNMRGEHKENNNTGHGDEFEFGYGFDGDDDERINKLSRGKAKKPVYDSSRAGVHTTENYGRLKHKRVLGTQLQESNGKSKTTRKKGCSQRRIYTSQIVIG